MGRTVKHISVFIAVSPTLTYGYAANPENLPNWASGLSSGLEKVGDDWVSESPMGKVKVKFVEKNPHFVLDHEVTLPNGMMFWNPMRVIAVGMESEVVFTLIKADDMSDKDFEQDASTIEKDLLRLKAILESKLTTR